MKKMEDKTTIEMTIDLIKDLPTQLALKLIYSELQKLRNNNKAI